MIDQKIIFGCNHIISTLEKQPTLFQIARSHSSYSDNITKTGSVVQVFYVYQLQTSPAQTIIYRYGVDYTISGNEITWISEHRPTDGTLYQCEALLVLRVVKDYTSNSALCDRCYGQGWYVDTTQSNNRVMETSGGINKLVQDFIKVIYTTTQADGYGTDLLNKVGAAVIDEELFLAEISTELNAGALQVQKKQATILAADESLLTPEEILSSIDVDTLEYSREESCAYVTLTLISAASSSAVVKFKF